jgi:uncharacterized membrane protein YdjX (TVP38/TMEM64 family)
MRRWWSLTLGIALLMLGIFFAANASGIAWLEDPMPAMKAARPAAAAIGVLLLILDIVLPVPSIPVMVALGALFGVTTGALLSLAGSIGCALVGFGIGRAGNGLIRRFVTPAEHERAGAYLQRWGVVAIALTRSIPIVAETVVILAGGSPVTWTQAIVATVAGSIIPCLVYAWAGASAQAVGMQSVIFLGVMAMTALLFLAGRRKPSAG